MKKYLMTLAAVLCCAMVSVLFTSCSKDDDNSGSDMYSYVASGNVTVKDAFVFPLTDYTDAIKSSVGSGLVKQNDQKVIQACDAVYSKHKSVYGSSISGTIQITRSKLGNSNSEQVIKEYTY